MNFFMRAVGGGSPLPNPETIFGDDLVFWWDTSNTKTLYQSKDDGVNETPLQYADADGDLVSMAYLMGPNALTLNVSISRNPTLATDSGRSCINFDGSNKYLLFTESKNIFTGFHKLNPTWTISFAIKRNSVDGTPQQILSSNGGSTSVPGIELRFNANNTITISVTHGVGGQSVISYTSTLTIADTNWHNVIITANSGGTGTGRLIVDNTTEVFNVSTVNGSTTATINDLRIGTRPSPVNYLNAKIADLVVVRRNVTTDEIAFLKQLNLPRYSKSFTIPVYDLNPSKLSTVWKDTSGTVPAVDGDKIALIQNDVAVGNFGTILRYANQPTSAQQPVWRDNFLNGKAVIELYGLDTPFPGNNSELLPTPIIGLGGGTQYIEIFLFYNTKDYPGSHVMEKSAAQYVVITGVDYPDNIVNGDGKPYMAYHLGSVNTVGTKSDVNANAWFLFGTVRNGDLETTYVLSSSGVRGSDAVGNDKMCTWSSIGRTEKPYPVGDNWWAHGYLARYQRYNGQMTQSQLAAKLNEIAAEYGL